MLLTRSRLTTDTEKTSVSFIFDRVSLSAPPGRFKTTIDIIGGVTLAMLKREYGARFGTAFALILPTHAIGLGNIELDSI